jgi:hypothetical protein
VQNGWALADASRVTSFLAIGGLTGCYFVSTQADRGRTVMALMGVYLTGALALALLATNPGAAWMWAVLIVFIGFGGIGASLTLAPLASTYYPPELRSTGVGWANGVGRAGSFFGPLALAWLMQKNLSPELVLGALMIPMALCAVRDAAAAGAARGAGINPPRNDYDRSTEHPEENAMSASNIARIVTAAVVALACGTASAAAPTVPGERWQHKMSMQMEGMNMAMPATEICAPVGQAAQELAKPDKNCKLTNVRQSGNRFMADVKCTGKDAMEGTMDMTTGPDRMTGKMTVRSADGEMTMVTESRKLGACQAMDTGAIVKQAEAQVQQGRQMAAQAEAQMCASDSFKLKGDPRQASHAATMFLGARALRRQAAARGVLWRGAVAGRIRFAVADGDGAGRRRPQPRACKLGSGKPAVDALREAAGLGRSRWRRRIPHRQRTARARSLPSRVRAEARCGLAPVPVGFLLRLELRLEARR